MAEAPTSTEVATFCPLCVSRCGARATLFDSTFMLDRDPSHLTGKVLCVKGKEAPAITAHPDRLRYPDDAHQPQGLGRPRVATHSHQPSVVARPSTASLMAVRLPFVLLSGIDHVAVLTGDTERFLEFYGVCSMQPTSSSRSAMDQADDRVGRARCRAERVRVVRQHRARASGAHVRARSPRSPRAGGSHSMRSTRSAAGSSLAA